MLCRLVEQRGESCGNELPRITTPVLVDRVAAIQDTRDIGSGIGAIDVVSGTEDIVVPLWGE